MMSLLEGPRGWSEVTFEGTKTNVVLNRPDSDCASKRGSMYDVMMEFIRLERTVASCSSRDMDG